MFHCDFADKRIAGNRSRHCNRILCYLLDETTKARDNVRLGKEERMQLKLAIQETPPSVARSVISKYSIVVSCNKCGGMHELGISVTMDNGPTDKQSIGDLYDGKSLPKNLADLSQNSVTCPKTGRQSTQRNNHQIFLVPIKN